MTSGEQARRPHSVPVAVSVAVRDRVTANLPTMPAFLAENPLTTVVLAAAHESRTMAGPTPDDRAGPSGRLVRRPDRNALLLPAGTDLDARAAELDASVRREPPRSS
jgi:hypothetical protein